MKDKIKRVAISKRTVVICITTLLFTSISFYSAHSLGNTAKNMYEHPYKVTNISRAMRSRLFDMKRFISMILTTNQDEQEINSLFEERYRMQSDAIAELYEVYLGSNDDIDFLNDAMNNLISVQKEAIEYSKTHTNDEISTYIKTDIYPYYDAVDSQLSTIIDSSDTRIYKMTNKTQLTSYSFMVGAAVFFLMIIILCIYMDRMNDKQMKVLLDREESLKQALVSAQHANNEKNKLKERLERENIRLECVKELYNNHDIDTALTNVLKYIGNLFLADRAYVLSFHDDDYSNVAEWCKEGTPSQIDKLKKIPMIKYEIWKNELDKENNLIINDIKEIKQVHPIQYEMFLQRGIRNLVWVSFTNGDKISGIIGLDNSAANMSEMIVPFLQTIQYFLSLSIQRQEDEKMLFELSQIDKLTSFYNRNRFIKDVGELKKLNNSIGVIYLDVNGLKEINDQSGHHAGDALLEKCAAVIRSNSTSKNLYRIGGDEFVILYLKIEEDVFYDGVKSLEKNFENSQCHIALGAKWSATTDNIQDVIRFADEAMYADKKDYYQGQRESKRYRHNNDFFG